MTGNGALWRRIPASGGQAIAGAWQAPHRLNIAPPEHRCGSGRRRKNQRSHPEQDSTIDATGAGVTSVERGQNEQKA